MYIYSTHSLLYLLFNNQFSATNAQAAAQLLIPEVLGLQYSSKHFSDYYMKHLKLAYNQEFSRIGSMDSLVPSAMFYNLHQNFGGFDREFGAVRIILT